MNYKSKETVNYKLTKQIKKHLNQQKVIGSPSAVTMPLWEHLKLCSCLIPHPAPSFSSIILLENFCYCMMPCPAFQACLLQRSFAMKVCLLSESPPLLQKYSLHCSSLQKSRVFPTSPYQSDLNLTS